MSPPADPSSVEAGLTRLADRARLSALTATGLGAAGDDAFDRVAALVRTVVDVPVALVSLVEDTRQVFPGLAGLGGAAGAARQTPLRQSMCQYVVGSAAPLVVDDTAADPRFAGSGARLDLDVAAYAGMPLTDAHGQVLGSLCAIDTAPRAWTESELALLRDLAAICSSELRLRIAQREATRAAARLATLTEVSRTLSTSPDVGVALARLAAVVVPGLADWCVIDRFDAPDQVDRVVVRHSDPRRTAEMAALTGRLPRVRPRSAASLARALTGGGRQVLRWDATADRAAAAPPPDTARPPGAGLPPGADLPAGPAASGVDRAADPDPLAAAQHALFDRLGARHAVVLPLTVRGGPLGALTLVRTGDHPFTVDEEQLLDELAARASLALARTRLFQQQRETARVLQSSMLTELPAPEDLALAARYLPAGEGMEVGGDWYDALTLPGGATAVVIGDVTGHDIGAAARMGQMRSMLRALLHDAAADVGSARVSPAAVLGRLDRAVAGLGLDGLATGVLALVEPDPGGTGWRLRWSSAGHPPPVVVARDGRVEHLVGERVDPMLGVVPDAVRHDSTAPLAPGDTVVLVTDGMLESADLPLDDGLERLGTTLARLAGRDVERLCAELVDELVGEHPGDDTAVVAVQVTGVPGDRFATSPRHPGPERVTIGP